jgi:hypothetical protein
VSLDDFLPEYEFVERHQRYVEAAPERALALALALPAAPDAIVRTLFRLRGVPSQGTLADLFVAIGLAEVERTPTSCVVAGKKLGVHIASDLVARADGDGSLLSTETRVHATTRHARRMFALYWLVVGPFSALIRRRWLRAAARAART